jgi:hypothetical protein
MYLYKVSFEEESSTIEYSSFVVSDSAKSAVDIVEEDNSNIERIKGVSEEQDVQYIGNISNDAQERADIEEVLNGVENIYCNSGREAEIMKKELCGYDTIYVTVNPDDMTVMTQTSFNNAKLPEGWSVSAIWVDKNGKTTIQVAPEEAIREFREEIKDSESHMYQKP